MTKLLISTLVFFLTSSLIAQEIKYVSPSSVENAKASITIESMKSTSGYIYGKLGAKNKSDGYLYCNLKKVTFKTAKNGSSYPTFGSMLVSPNSQRSANFKSKIGENVDEFDFLMTGASYAAPSSTYLTAPSLTIKKGENMTVGNFTVKILTLNTEYKKKNTARVEVIYNGSENQVGVIDFKALKVDGSEVKVVKKSVGLMKGQSAKAYIDIKSKEKGALFTLEDGAVFTFLNALQELKLEKINFPSVHIQKEGYLQKFNPIHAVNGAYKPFTDNSSKAVKVTFFNTENEGFKIFSEGSERTAYYTTNATIGMDQGTANIQIMLDGIETAAIKTDLTFAANIATAKYQIKKEASGAYTLHFIGSSEASATTPSNTPQNNQGSNANVNNNGTASCELSFSDFTSLKKDIKTEADAGGNPAGLASEVLFVKKCISTAQVVELMEAFNLDNNRLAFAKTAHQYTSDKNKYFQVVQKLSYSKNKEALENHISK